jgi:uncharacterized Rmd1/YagE family protein
MSKNRFASLTAAKTLQKSKVTLPPEKQTKARQKVNKQQQVTTQADIETPRRGRPNGKRSNENFRQVTAYVGTETYKRTKMKLLVNDSKQEFSQLVDELLNKWLEEK